MDHLISSDMWIYCRLFNFKFSSTYQDFSVFCILCQEIVFSYQNNDFVESKKKKTVPLGSEQIGFWLSFLFDKKLFRILNRKHKIGLKIIKTR